MVNDQKSRIAAVDIFREGYQNYFFDRDVTESKKFFLALRDAVIHELTTMGYCVLIENLLEKNRGRIDVIAYAVFADIVKGFENNTLVDVEKDPGYKEYVPHVSVAGRHLSWVQCGRYGEIYMSGNEVLDVIRNARKIVRSYRRTGSEEAKTFSGEQDQAEKTTKDKIMEEAKTEAKRLLEEAGIEAGKIIENAKTEAKTIRDNAYEEICVEAKKTSEKLIDSFLLAEQKRYKNELNDEMRKFTDSYIDNASRAMTVHTEMCDATNAFQAKWIQTLDDTIKQITAVKAEFYSHLHDWQVSLFPREIKPLAERFLELYRIINVDKLLREEILFEPVPESQENNDGKEQHEEKSEVADTRIAGLQRLNKTLTTFLRRFEVSLNGLDLYVYYPKAGDAFDEMWHIPDDEGEAYMGKRIKECIVPGIAKKAHDEYGDDVLIPAVVKVEMES